MIYPPSPSLSSGTVGSVSTVVGGSGVRDQSRCPGSISSSSFTFDNPSPFDNKKDQQSTSSSINTTPPVQQPAPVPDIQLLLSNYHLQAKVQKLEDLVKALLGVTSMGMNLGHAQNGDLTGIGAISPLLLGKNEQAGYNDPLSILGASYSTFNNGNNSKQSLNNDSNNASASTSYLSPTKVHLVNDLLTTTNRYLSNTTQTQQAPPILHTDSTSNSTSNSNSTFHDLTRHPAAMATLSFHSPTISNSASVDSKRDLKERALRRVSSQSLIIQLIGREVDNVKEADEEVVAGTTSLNEWEEGLKSMRERVNSWRAGMEQSLIGVKSMECLPISIPV